MKLFISAFFLLFSFFSFSQENGKHIVQKGESLYSISKKYKISVSQLEELNPSVKTKLAINSVLLISAKPENAQVSQHTVLAKETVYGLSKKYNISIEKIQEFNPTIESEGLKIGQVLRLSKSKNYSVSEKVLVEQPIIKSERKEELQQGFHTVLPKETKYGLSKKYKISIAELEKLNPQIKNGLEVGTQIVLKTSYQFEPKEIENPVVEKDMKPIPVGNFSMIASVIASASNNIGVKYRSGGTDSNGFDCSGLMFTSFKTIDVMLPRTSLEQATFGFQVDKNLAQKGDLIFFATNNSDRINHVGLITEVSENDIKFVHSSTSSGVIVSSLSEEYYDNRFVQINRVITQ